jgi:hypothetical protein
VDILTQRPEGQQCDIVKKANVLVHEAGVMGDSGVPEADTASDVASVTSGGRPAEPVESTDSRLGRLMAAVSNQVQAKGFVGMLCLALPRSATK